MCFSTPNASLSYRFNQEMMKEGLPPMPFGMSSTEMAGYMLKNGEKMMKIKKKFFKREHLDPNTFEERPCTLASCTKMATKKCSRCKAVYYCSMECNTANWKVHKKDCKKVEKVEDKAIKEKADAGRFKPKNKRTFVNENKEKSRNENKSKSSIKTAASEVNFKKEAKEPISDEQANKNLVRALKKAWPETKVMNKKGQEYPKNY